MQLYKIMLISAFSRGGEHGMHIALSKVIGLLVGAVLLGGVIASSLGDMPLVLPQATPSTILTTALVTQLAVLFTMLTALGLIRSHNTDVVGRLLLALPVSGLQRWCALMMPGFIMALTAVILVCWPLWSFMQPSAISPFHFLAGLALGTGSAMGLIYGIPRRFVWAQLVIIAAALWYEYTLLQNANISLVVGRQDPSLAIMGALFASSVFLFLQSYRVVTYDTTYSTYRRSVHGAQLPVSIWFLKKLFRNSSTLLGFITTLAACSAIAWVWKEQPLLDADVIAFIGAILLAAYVSDIRGISRLHKPAEITAIRGTGYFITHYVVAATVACTVLASSIVYAGLHTTHQVIPTNLTIYLTLGLAIGLFSGSLVAPGPRDISGQIFAVLLCIGIIMVVPVIPYNDTTVLGAPLVPLSLTTSLLVTSYLIEYRRNKYIWRISND